MRRWCLALCCSFSLLALIPSAAFAQETTAILAGMVTDESGAVLPGAVVSLKHLPTGHVTEIVTGTEGVYHLPLLPIGAYEVTFSLQGFQPRVVKGVVLAVNDRVRLDAVLKTGGVSEVIQVTGQTQVQTTTAVQTLIDSQQVQELPINNRNFAKLAELAPGVSSDLAEFLASDRENAAHRSGRPSLSDLEEHVFE